ncbi:hypothetical protein JRO89_XS04G0015900 [Xanthoceras sorbifolium]|uniref:Uncharacterized protein n=1 Tax=Xanthoceras sorbifolium TaxID=99658 RepID=A0ABQ8I3S1_9ROSI|nr:hypothetical protein JRO89_XS04G0015900 [Xanthoceras sorbifolium]
MGILHSFYCDDSWDTVMKLSYVAAVSYTGLMACRTGAMRLQSSLLILESDICESSYRTLSTCPNQKWKNEPSISGQASKIGIKFTSFPQKRYI